MAEATASGSGLPYIKTAGDVLPLAIALSLKTFRTVSSFATRRDLIRFIKMFPLMTGV
jgi:hypothetical protein